jgi:hypothetical protein
MTVDGARVTFQLTSRTALLVGRCSLEGAIRLGQVRSVKSVNMRVLQGTQQRPIVDVRCPA